MTAVAPLPLSAHSSGEISAGITVPTTTRSKPSSRTAIQHERGDPAGARRVGLWRRSRLSHSTSSTSEHR